MGIAIRNAESVAHGSPFPLWRLIRFLGGEFRLNLVVRNR